MLHTLSIGQLAEHLATRQLSSVELTRHFLARIERLNPALNALITVTGEAALVAAASADARLAAGEKGPLLGIPLIHKDIFCTDGVRTSCGSRMLDNFIAPYDATRKHVRQMIEPYGGFILVHIATSVEVCEQRDRKGLYAKARAGILKEFTGISDPYEAPTDAEVTINTGDLSPEEAAQEIILHLEREVVEPG